MVIVEENKPKRKYKMPDMPKFKTRRGSIAWLLRQRRNARILNVKSVSVQVKDINMMIYSKDARFLSLYAKLKRAELKGGSFDGEDYVLICKTSDPNKSLMYSILESDWLLNINELDEMCIELVEAKKETDECQLQILKDNKVKYPHLKLDDRIKLLEYKLECLNEYLVNRKSKIKKLS